MSSSISQTQVEDSINSSKLSEVKPVDIEQDPQQALKRIRKDYSALQAQYEEAMMYVQQMDEVHRQLGVVTKENTKLKSEKDEIERRLQIALQVNEELNSKLLLNKTQNTQPKINSNIKLLYEQDKIKADEQIQKLSQSLSETEKLLNDQKSETEKLQNNIKKILNSIKTKFNKKFDSVNELTEFILNINVQPESDTGQPPPSISSSLLITNENQSSELESKIESYKQKYSEEKRNNKELQKALKKISRKHRNLSKSQEYEVDHLNDQITEMQTSLKKSQHEFEQQINQKQIENEKMKIELESSKMKIDELNRKIQQQQKIQFQMDLQLKQNEQQAQLNEISKNENASQVIINQCKGTIRDLKQQLEAQTSKSKEVAKLYISLKKQLGEVSQKVEFGQKEKSEILLKLKSAESENTKFAVENESLKEEINRLKIERDNLEMKIACQDSENKANKVKLEKMNGKVEDLSLQIEKFKTERTVFYSLIDMQKKEIAEIYQERDKIFVIVRKQSALLKQCEFQIGSLSQEKTDLIHQIDFMSSSANNNNNFNNGGQFDSLIKSGMSIDRQSINSKMNSNVSQTFQKQQTIPLTTWTSNELPANLVQPILEIGEKEDLSISEKIQKVISKIATFYNAELASKDESLKTLASDNENCQSLFQQFVDSVCDLIGEKKTDVIRMNQHAICSRIGQIVKENSTMLNEITKFDNSFQSLFKKLKVKSFPEALKEIESIFKAIEKIDSKLKKQKGINRKLVGIIDAAQNESFEKQSELESIIEEQKKLNEYTCVEKDSLTQENSELKSRYQKLMNDYESLQSSSDEVIEKIKLNNESQINDLSQKYQNEQESLLSEIMDKENQIKELKEANSKSEASLTKVLKSTSILKNNYDSQKVKISQLQSNFDDMQKQYKEKLVKEKENFNNQLNKTIEKFKNKNESLRLLLDKATSALSETDIKNRDLITSNNQLNVEKQQLAAKIETQKQEIEREKKLSESKLKAMQLAIDVKNQSTIENELSKFENDKRAIFTQIANSFKQYYDARQKLNESNLKNLLEKVSMELNRLLMQEASLKTLLGVKQGEHLEDAVSKLFMNVYNNVNK